MSNANVFAMQDRRPAGWPCVHPTSWIGEHDSLHMDKELALQGLPFQVYGIIGSVLGLVGMMSVYCDWLR